MADGSIGTATVMFTDLVASTQLRQRLGEDAAELLRVQHDRLLTDTVESNDGRVIKRLGDGVMASFASCTNALAAAVGIQQTIDLENRRPGGEDLAVRIGISVGDVTFDGDDCFGLAVVEAQRLESAADPGAIWCTDVVAQLARGRGGHTFVSLGELSLKGLADPVAASSVLWEPIRETSDPDAGLPAVLAGSGFPFSGRAEIFEQLLQSWNVGAAGGFAVALLAGEPGAGKTRLAQELARRVRTDGTVDGVPPLVLAGRCDEEGAPFQPFGTALEYFVRQESPDRTALGDFPGDLDRLVPRLGDLVEGLPPPLRDEPDAERHRLFQAVESWLSVGGAQRPRLLVIDDLHWADQPTLLLVKHLIRFRPNGLVIVGTYRDTDVDRAHPLSAMLSEYRTTSEITRIRVGGLGLGGVCELLERAGGHGLDDLGRQFAERVQRETSGNPFFVGEVLRDLIENGTLVQRDGQWTSELQVHEAGISEGVREVVGQRLHRLGEAVEQVLRTAAVIGFEFDVSLLADVLGFGVDGVLDALDAATAANLLIDVGADRHRFAHGLVRETLHGELSSSRRSREHRKVALALEARHAGSLDDVTPDLAAHWTEATIGGDRGRAIEFSVRAAELAADRGAHENAARWIRRSLELMADDDRDWSAEHRRVLVHLAEAEAVSAMAPEARLHALEAGRAAVDAEDPATAVRALRVRARHSFSASDPADPERVELLRDALSMSSLDPWQRAALLGELAKELIFERDLPGRRRALEEREALLSELPLVERVELVATAGTTSYIWAPRSVLQRQADEARAVLDDTPAMHASVRWRILGHLAYTALHLGDRFTLDGTIDAMTSLGPEIGAVRKSMTRLHETMRSLIDGDVSGAQQSANALVAQLEQLGVPEAVAYRSTTTLAISRERGTLADLGPVVDALVAGAHPVGPERTTAAFVRMLRGDLDIVRAALHDLDDQEFADDATVQLCVAFWAEIVAGLRSDEHCARFIDILEAASGVNLLIGGMYLGPVDRLLALLHEARGEHGRADELFEAAVAQQSA
ncbi:MAG TPA: AAA family ATPase, partial [Ilumatobacteraceae bacterium]|nr:AAA family ATPase [Ilumatobacteraceae bacterium]